MSVLILYATSNRSGTNFDNYALLADAFMHGHAWITWPGDYIDAIPYNGQRYIIEAPFPALIVAPFVLIWGPTGIAQSTASIVAGAAAMAFFWLLFRRLGLRRAQRLALCAFAFAGTDLWWCSSIGDVWFYSPVVAVACTALALWECFGRKRAWLIGLAAICAFESRGTTAPAILMYPLLFSSGSASDVRRKWIAYGSVLAAGAFAYIAYNEIRWQTASDLGYTLFCAQDTYCAQTPFGLKYLPYELYSFFVRAPDLVLSNLTIAEYPYLHISSEGIALTFTSPALLIAFWCRRSRAEIALWITAVLVAIPEFTYYVNGFKQVGMRHALDFEPFLIALMAFAFRARGYRWFYLLIAFSVIVGVWQVWYWNTFEH